MCCVWLGLWISCSPTSYPVASSLGPCGRKFCIRIHADSSCKRMGHNQRLNQTRIATQPQLLLLSHLTSICHVLHHRCGLQTKPRYVPSPSFFLSVFPNKCSPFSLSLPLLCESIIGVSWPLSLRNRLCPSFYVRHLGLCSTLLSAPSVPRFITVCCSFTLNHTGILKYHTL